MRHLPACIKNLKQKQLPTQLVALIEKIKQVCKLITVEGEFTEILSIDSDLEYYDIQRGIINKFSENDLNNVNKKSKDFICEKVGESVLFSIARKQASDTVGVIRELIESVG